MDSVNVVHDRINAIGPASVRLTLIETHGVHSHEPTKHEIHFFVNLSFILIPTKLYE